MDLVDLYVNGYRETVVFIRLLLTMSIIYFWV